MKYREEWTASGRTVSHPSEHFPVEFEPKIETWNTPVIIETACPGWQLGGERFPAIPLTVKDQVKVLSESIWAGAVAVHVHPRDDTGMPQVDPKLMKRVLDPVFEEVGDLITLNHTFKPAPEPDYASDTMEMLEIGGGNKYCQGSVVLPIGYVGRRGQITTIEATCEAVRWLEEHQIKPVFQCYDSHSHFGFKQHVFDRGYSKDPRPLMNLHMGKHHSHAVHQDPWAQLNVITNYNMVKATVPNATVGIYPGGRNWIHVMVTGLLLGAQLVRVGVEDCYWMYPHEDQVIPSNVETVKLTVEFAKLLHRRVVTDPAEARQILGIVRTS